MAEATSWQKEQFSRAYVLAVATRGGYTLADWNVDKDGVDVTLRWKGLMVDFQLKCTQSPRAAKGDYVFDLDLATYNKLRDPERSAPGYLALAVVPKTLDKWLLHEPERLLMSCHTYWAKLQDEPPPTASKTTAIHLPRCQTLTINSLERMFEASRQHILNGTIEGGLA
ncbi:DUF4365 domain-containing protein [Nonomuraea guangzhouensis]|uniref:DUF4365 domain-containing protein n=1 Tax=Nonomuraea guangzhouensis TaxID=1291555 RepID=A0ABW4GWX9_9ACTN|nr:DUF4365 domain-containing protein [Nonomuraea guangzhouensis]